MRINIDEIDQKERLDILLNINGLAESREKAKKLILDDCVFVNNCLINKPSAKFSVKSEITVKTDSKQYVGRGAYKLEKAINTFNIKVQDTTAVDIGASTGGFSDFLIQHGAKKVYAIDVGHDQLHEKLKSNKKIINLENTNFRYIDSKLFQESIDIIVVDVSFISLSLIIPKIVEISHLNTDIVVLIKPQFEAGKNNIGKNGIVKDKKIHLSVLNNFNNCCLFNDIYVENITYSPIKGGNGNIEYLAHLKRGNISRFDNEKFKSIIKDAFVLL